MKKTIAKEEIEAIAYIVKVLLVIGLIIYILTN